MIKNLIKKYIFVSLILCTTLSAAQVASPVNVKLDHVDVARIDVVAEKYSKQFSHAKRMKSLRNWGLGIGVTALIAWIVYDSYFRKHEVGEIKIIDETAKKKLEAARLQDLEEEHERNKNPLKAIPFIIKTAIVLGIAQSLIDAFWNAAGAGSNLFHGLFSIGNVADVKSFQQKQAQIKELLIRLATLPELNGKVVLPSTEDKVLFEISLSDVILTHRTMIYFLEDMLGFIKFLVTLAHGKESYEFAAVTGHCALISAEFNKASDKITLIVNHDQKIDRQAFISDFALFCRKFTKFVCDCGVNLYGQDFLQK
ncbi:MAG: hypothetical protein US49_C0005G0017 [candidate division TM6 bacterium GW2011_GWF2_37_49]|nr:MAG: hypothetical protein US49_C0005G0017 [candidate division TM6 bacterium GW2011_GWF2_37_49]